MDVSEVDLGAMLSQEVRVEEQQMLYLSRKLFPWEMNYSVIEKEALAVKWAIETLCYYLLGNSILFVTDHTPLSS